MRLWKMMLELNSFKHDPSNERQILYQRYATRLYLLLIVFSLVILNFYLSLVETTYRSTVLHPTEFQYIQLEEHYPNSVSCPCTQISTPYSQLITIDPQFHQLCSSDFVSPQWMNYTYSAIRDVLYTADYRLQATLHFQLLTTFCQQAQKTIDNALRVFLQTQYVSAQVVHPRLFDSQVKSFIEDWQSITVNRFLQTIDLIRATTEGNQLWTNSPNIFSFATASSGRVSIRPQQISNCFCDLSAQCRSELSTLAGETISGIIYGLNKIPNFFFGCYPVEALLASTMECFYNQSCIDVFGQYFNFSPLNKSRNRPNETVGSIIDRLMVDSWSSNVSFTSHYKSCAPSLCTFEDRRPHDVFLIITTTIGTFGGLSLGLQLIIFLVLRLTEKLTVGFSWLGLIHFITHIFKCDNEHQMIRRLHLVLTLMTIYVLYAFSAFRPQLTVVNVSKPTFSHYQNLLNQSFESLDCSCSQISIKYQLFLTMIPRFHEVCSSDFVSEAWIAFLYEETDSDSRFPPSDFRISASKQFQFLALLCQLSQTVVNNLLSQLLKSDLIDTQLLSLVAFEERVQTAISQFQLTMPQSFLNALSLIRESTAANMLMTRLSTTWEVKTPVFRNTARIAYVAPLFYDGCSCSLSSKCAQPSMGMLAGCYPIEALLQTTLQCLYRQSCLDQWNTSRALITLASNSSHFLVNSTFEDLAKELMVEEYFSNTSYENYFTQCAPSSCSYSYMDRSNILEGMAILISLYSGLVIIDGAVALMIVKLFRRASRKISPQTDD